MTLEDFQYVMAIKGWVLFPSQISLSLIHSLREDLIKAIDRCDKIRKKNGVGEKSLGVAHHLVGWEPSFMDLLENLPLLDFVQAHLQSPCILNSFGGGFSQSHDSLSYLLHPHRDTKIFSLGAPSMVNMLIMLDDFTEENGATHILSGSHHVKAECPSKELFYEASHRFLGKAGTIVLFDGNCWHGAGHNGTKRDRGVLTLTFTTPYLKPQLEYTHAFSEKERDSLSPSVQALLGFQSQVPHTLEEWYQPPEKRKFKPTFIAKKGSL
jgi:hypothetical protein